MHTEIHVPSYAEYLGLSYSINFSLTRLHRFMANAHPLDFEGIQQSVDGRTVTLMRQLASDLEATVAKLPDYQDSL